MIEIFLFVVIHERVGFCFGMATAFVISELVAWIAHLVGAS